MIDTFLVTKKDLSQVQIDRIFERSQARSEWRRERTYARNSRYALAIAAVAVSLIILIPIALLLIFLA